LRLYYGYRQASQIQDELAGGLLTLYQFQFRLAIQFRRHGDVCQVSNQLAGAAAWRTF
jgi:hypothetical protein